MSREGDLLWQLIGIAAKSKGKLVGASAEIAIVQLLLGETTKSSAGVKKDPSASSKRSSFSAPLKGELDDSAVVSVFLLFICRLTLLPCFL
jgi:hypothetical protein